MSPSFQYVGTRPEHVAGIPAGDISEPAYEALPWELQQAVLNNRGSDGGPLYVERPSRAERKRVRDLMGPEPDAANEAEPDTADAAEPEPEPVAAPEEAQPVVEPDQNQPVEQPA